jgi:cbb3-type cytochrome oxidase cytochrome c subunit
VQLLHLRNPRGVSPGSVMPSFAHLSDEDLNALVDYLLTLK